jgi:hypothetical protein
VIGAVAVEQVDLRNRRPRDASRLRAAANKSMLLPEENGSAASFSFGARGQ